MSIDQAAAKPTNSISPDKQMKSIVIFSVLLLFLALVVLILTQPISQDEGVFLTISRYLNHGWFLYQDFFDHKPPAIYWLLAGLFKFFGTNVFVPKIALILSILGSSVPVGKIGERIKKRSGWCAAGIFLFLMTQFEGNFLIAEPFLLLPLLLSLWLLLRSEKSNRLLLLAGIALGIVPLFKQTAVLSILPILILAFRLTKKQKLVFIAGLAVPWFLLGAYLWFHGLLSEAYRQVVTLTLTSYPRESLLSVLQFLKNNFFWTVPIWILLILGLVTKFHKKKLIWSFVLLPLPFMFFRHYPHYWVQLLPFVALIAAAVLVEIRRPALTMATLVFCLAVAGGKIAQEVVPNYHLWQEQVRVADVLRQEPADVLLAENQFTAFYFLLPQRPLNKYLYITEITNADGAEQQTITDLQRGQRTLILWPQDPNFAYAKKLQKFIVEHSTEQQVFPSLGMRAVIYNRVISQ